MFSLISQMSCLISSRKLKTFVCLLQEVEVDMKVLSSMIVASLLLSLSVTLSGNILLYLNIIGVFVCAGQRSCVRVCARVRACVCVYVPACVYAGLNKFIFMCLFVGCERTYGMDTCVLMCLHTCIVCVCWCDCIPIYERLLLPQTP